jgi:hypothetical protein
MATTSKTAKPTVTKVTKQKPKTRTKASAKPATKAAAKPASKPRAKPLAKTETKATAKPTVTKVTKQKPKTASSAKATKPATKTTPTKVKVEKKNAFKGTVYHVSKRENNGREWKVFIEKSTKPIKIFDTQAEALDYAKDLATNKADGSYVILHGLDGKIRKY